MAAYCAHNIRIKFIETISDQEAGKVALWLEMTVTPSIIPLWLTRWLTPAITFPTIIVLHFASPDATVDDGGRRRWRWRRGDAAAGGEEDDTAAAADDVAAAGSSNGSRGAPPPPKICLQYDNHTLYALFSPIRWLSGRALLPVGGWALVAGGHVVDAADTLLRRISRRFGFRFSGLGPSQRPCSAGSCQQ